MKKAVDRCAVRLAALRMLLQRVSTPEAGVVADVKPEFIALVLAGRTETEICAALDMTPRDVVRDLAELARCEE